MKNKNMYREKLYNHTMPVREGLWEAIEAQLPPKKEERVFPLFWLTLFASTLIGGALMLGIVNKNQSNDSRPSIQLPTANQATTETTQAYADAITSTESSSISTTTLSPSSTNHSTLEPSSTSSASNSISNITSNTTITSNKAKPSGKNTYTGLNKNTSSKKSLQTSKTEQQSVALKYDATTAARHTPATDMLAPSEMNVSNTSQRELTALHTDPNCYKFSGPADKHAVSADLFAGPGFSPNSFEATDGESSIYAQARETTEHNQYAWSAGGRINLLFRNGLGARLGLTYTQAGDIFDYTDTLATKSSTQIDSFFAADGSFLYADTSRVLVFGTLIKKIHNTYRYLDIPLLASFEVPLGRSIFMINAGPVFNLTSSHEGQILDADLNPGSITPGKSNEIPVYKTNLGINLYVGAGIVFPLMDHISGIVEPSFLYRLKPVTLDSYSLKEHRHYAGLNLGIRYHFD